MALCHALSMFYLQVKHADCMIGTQSGWLRAYVNKMRQYLSPKHSLVRLEISRLIDPVIWKLICAISLGRHVLTISFSCSSHSKKETNSKWMKKKPTNGKMLSVLFLNISCWVVKLSIVSILGSSVSYWLRVSQASEILAPAFISCEWCASHVVSPDLSFLISKMLIMNSL